MQIEYQKKKKGVTLMPNFTWVQQQDFMLAPPNDLIFTSSPAEAVSLNRDDASGLLNVTVERVPETHSGC